MTKRNRNRAEKVKGTCELLKIFRKYIFDTRVKKGIWKK